MFFIYSFIHTVNAIERSLCFLKNENLKIFSFSETLAIRICIRSVF